MKDQAKIVTLFGFFILCVIILTLSTIVQRPQQTFYGMIKQNELTSKEHFSEDLTQEITKSGFLVNDTCMKRLPQAIIIGIQKCGTTSLLRFLNNHPKIVACTSPAETQFFSNHYSRGLGWYKNLMPCSYSNQVTMEKSPPYFYRDFCATRIRKMNPKTKLILTVKEPVERAVSMYAMYIDNGEIKNVPFEDYVMSKNRTVINSNSKMLQFSNYPKHMKSWLENFELKQILIIDGDKFVKNPSEELTEVEHFLGIENYFTPKRFVFNATKGKYCILKNGKPACLSERKGRTHPTIDPEVRQKLQRFFKPLNQKFFKMINRTFNWGY